MVVAAQLLLSGPAFAETRLALIITNAAYPIEVGSLSNPHQDGAMIADALKAVGFKPDNIAVIKDADQQSLRLVVADFVDRIEKAGPEAVAFLYYSGHGAADRTERGENYLIPIGAKITSARQLPIMGVSLTEITKTLERIPAKARFVVVDACRNVAFAKGLKDASKGFTPERRLDGMIVAFATSPGETADDNSNYAAALAHSLPTPGLMAEEVFKETQLQVASLSGGKQVPWTEDGLLTRFQFKEAPTKSKPQPLLSEAARAWGDIKDLRDVEVFEVFRKQYGPTNALYETLATRRIAELTPPPFPSIPAPNQLSVCDERQGSGCGSYLRGRDKLCISSLNISKLIKPEARACTLSVFTRSQNIEGEWNVARSITSTIADAKVADMCVSIHGESKDTYKARISCQ